MQLRGKVLSSKTDKLENNEVFVEKKFSQKSYHGGPVKGQSFPSPSGSSDSTGASAPSSIVPTVANIPEGETASSQASINLEKVEKSSLPYFSELLDFDNVLEHWSKRLLAYMTQTERQCQFNVWSGVSLTGKTSLAKRLSGGEGFKPFSLHQSGIFYFDCYTVKDNFERLRNDWMDVKKTPPNTIVFIDEFEKLMDPQFKLVDEVYVRKVRKYFEDLYRTQKIMFVFLTGAKIDRDSVVQLLGPKLTSLTDFSLVFPDWTLQRLTTLIVKNMHARNLQITDMAAATLALHASRHTKILEVQGVLPLLEIELKINGQSTIDEELMEKVLKGRG